MADKLTIKQEKFCQGLFSGLTQREAYKQAFNCVVMKDKSIDERASRLNSMVKVQSRLKELTDEIKNRNMVTVERVLAEYAKIGFADIKDFLEFGTRKVREGFDKDGEPVYGYRQVIEAKPSDEVDGTLISEVSISDNGTFKFKLHDKKGALDMMGKHLGMFIEKIEEKSDQTITIKLEGEAEEWSK